MIEKKKSFAGYKYPIHRLLSGRANAPGSSEYLRLGLLCFRGRLDLPKVCKENLAARDEDAKVRFETRARASSGVHYACFGGCYLWVRSLLEHAGVGWQYRCMPLSVVDSRRSYRNIASSVYFMTGNQKPEKCAVLEAGSLV